MDGDGGVYADPSAVYHVGDLDVPVKAIVDNHLGYDVDTGVFGEVPASAVADEAISHPLLGDGSHVVHIEPTTYEIDGRNVMVLPEKDVRSIAASLTAFGQQMRHNGDMTEDEITAYRKRVKKLMKPSDDLLMHATANVQIFHGPGVCAYSDYETVRADLNTFLADRSPDERKAVEPALTAAIRDLLLEQLASEHAPIRVNSRWMHLHMSTARSDGRSGPELVILGTNAVRVSSFLTETSGVDGEAVAVARGRESSLGHETVVYKLHPVGMTMYVPDVKGNIRVRLYHTHVVAAFAIAPDGTVARVEHIDSVGTLRLMTVDPPHDRLNDVQCEQLAVFDSDPLNLPIVDHGVLRLPREERAARAKIDRLASLNRERVPDHWDVDEEDFTPTRDRPRRGAGFY